MAKGGGIGGYLKELVVGVFLLAVMLPVALTLFIGINITDTVDLTNNTEYTTLVTAWPYIGVAVVAGVIIYFVWAAFKK